MPQGLIEPTLYNKYSSQLVDYGSINSFRDQVEHCVQSLQVSLSLSRSAALCFNPRPRVFCELCATICVMCNIYIWLMLTFQYRFIVAPWRTLYARDTINKRQFRRASNFRSSLCGSFLLPLINQADLI